MVNPFFHMDSFPSRKVSNTALSSVLLFQQYCTDYSGTGELPSLFAPKKWGEFYKTHQWVLQSRHMPQQIAITLTASDFSGDFKTRGALWSLALKSCLTSISGKKVRKIKINLDWCNLSDEGICSNFRKLFFSALHQLSCFAYAGLG